VNTVEAQTQDSDESLIAARMERVRQELAYSLYVRGGMVFTQAQELVKKIEAGTIQHLHIKF